MGLVIVYSVMLKLTIWDILYIFVIDGNEILNNVLGGAVNE